MPKEYIAVSSFHSTIYRLLEDTNSLAYEVVLEAALELTEPNNQTVEYPGDLFKALHKQMPRDSSYASKSWHNNVDRLRKALQLH